MFDMYCSYTELRPHVLDAARRTGKSFADVRVLILGCGESRLPQQLAADKFTSITAIDKDAALIDSLSVHAAHPAVRYFAMDCRTMDLPSEGYDLVIDKALSDTLACGPQSFASLLQMHKEVMRVLAPGGTYFALSFQDPDERLQHLTRPGLFWRVEHCQIVAYAGKEERRYHGYVCGKEHRTFVPVDDDE
jgi:SAM-dependent methyltransferase